MPVIDEFRPVDFTKTATPEETAATGGIGLPVAALLSLAGAFAVRKTKK